MDLAFEVSAAAQRTSMCMHGDLAAADKLVRKAQLAPAVGLRVLLGQKPPWKQNLIAFADSTYANIDNLKSQFGVVVSLTTDSAAYLEG